MTRSTPLSILPPLTTEEAEHSARVEALIRRRIAESDGWIDFETFMDLALYAPGLGYYSAGSAKLGRAGDFVTAPELSDLFSRCVARQCAEVLRALGSGEILELGAGTGRMAAVILRALAELDVLPERYAILEVSADLRTRQRERIERLPPELRGRVVWLDRWPARPITGVVLANEVLDALACQRFVIHRAAAQGGEAPSNESRPAARRTADPRLGELGISQLGVGASPDGALIEIARRAEADFAAAVAELLSGLSEPLPDGYRSELCLRAAPWIAGLADVLARGVALIFDYGLPRAHYYHPDRVSGTLRCHFKQRAHDEPLVRVGVQDITAWVDFTRVAEAAHDAGLEVLGFATQAAFLLGAGIDALLAESSGIAEHARLAGEARRLLLPGEMGEAFKAMALGRGYDGGLRGFAHQDLRGSL